MAAESAAATHAMEEAGGVALARRRLAFLGGPGLSDSAHDRRALAVLFAASLHRSWDRRPCTRWTRPPTSARATGGALLGDRVARKRLLWRRARPRRRALRAFVVRLSGVIPGMLTLASRDRLSVVFQNGKSSPAGRRAGRHMAGAGRAKPVYTADARARRNRMGCWCGCCMNPSGWPWWPLCARSRLSARTIGIAAPGTEWIAFVSRYDRGVAGSLSRSKGKRSPRRRSASASP